MNSRFNKPTEVINCPECGQPMNWIYSVGTANIANGVWLVRCEFVVGPAGRIKKSCFMFGEPFRPEKLQGDFELRRELRWEKRRHWLKHIATRADFERYVRANFVTRDREVSP